MPNYIKTQQLEERYQKLPEVLKNALFSVDIAEKIMEIGKKTGLTVEKTGFLAEEVGAIILGLTKPQEFIPKLTQSLEIDAGKARDVAAKINHEILLPLRESLKTSKPIEKGEQKKPKNEMAEKSILPEIDQISGSIPEPVTSTPTRAEPAVTERKFETTSLIEQQKVVTDTEPKPEPPKHPKPTSHLPKLEVDQTKPSIPTIRRVVEQPKPVLPKADLAQNIADRPKNWDNKTELMSRTILSVPPTEKTPPPPLPITPVPSAVPPPVEKKSPNRGFDPYREQTE